MTSNLIEFAGRALEKGLERDEIAQALQAAGWPKDKVAAALDAYADVDFALPVPKPRPHVSARATFTHLLLFSSLYICIWAFLALTFTFIDRVLPDPFEGTADHSTTVRIAISSLVVFFPLFAFMFRLTNRNRADPALRASTVRRWFVYLTLFAAAVTIAGCVVILVYVFLSGELSSRFLLKILTDAIVAGGIFVYFLQDVRQDLSEAASLRLSDRATGTAYGYILNENRRFQLCADFATVSTEAKAWFPPEASGWKHQAGHVCFAFSAPSSAPK
jgi:hypothetical protein